MICINWTKILTTLKPKTFEVFSFKSLKPTVLAAIFQSWIAPTLTTGNLRPSYDCPMSIMEHLCPHKDTISCNHSIIWNTIQSRLFVAKIIHNVLSDMLNGYHSSRVAPIQRTCHYLAASASRRGGLRSATTSNLVIPRPRCRLTTYGTRASSVAGPVCWNALPGYLKTHYFASP